MLDCKQKTFLRKPLQTKLAVAIGRDILQVKVATGCYNHDTENWPELLCCFCFVCSVMGHISHRLWQFNNERLLPGRHTSDIMFHKQPSLKYPPIIKLPECKDRFHFPLPQCIICDTGMEYLECWQQKVATAKVSIAVIIEYNYNIFICNWWVASLQRKIACLYLAGKANTISAIVNLTITVKVAQW